MKVLIIIALSLGLASWGLVGCGVNHYSIKLEEPEPTKPADRELFCEVIDNEMVCW